MNRSYASELNTSICWCVEKCIFCDLESAMGGKNSTLRSPAGHCSKLLKFVSMIIKSNEDVDRYIDGKKSSVVGRKSAFFGSSGFVIRGDGDVWKAPCIEPGYDIDYCMIAINFVDDEDVPYQLSLTPCDNGYGPDRHYRYMLRARHNNAETGAYPIYRRYVKRITCFQSFDGKIVNKLVLDSTRLTVSAATPDDRLFHNIPRSYDVCISFGEDAVRGLNATTFYNAETQTGIYSNNCRYYLQIFDCFIEDIRKFDRDLWDNEPFLLRKMNKCVFKCVDETGDYRVGKYCAGCKAVKYCCVECQRRDWTRHRRDCATHQYDVLTRDSMDVVCMNKKFIAAPNGGYPYKYSFHLIMFVNILRDISIMNATYKPYRMTYMSPQYYEYALAAGRTLFAMGGYELMKMVFMNLGVKYPEDLVELNDCWETIAEWSFPSQYVNEIIETNTRKYPDDVIKELRTHEFDLALQEHDNIQARIESVCGKIDKIKAIKRRIYARRGLCENRAKK